MSTLHVKYLQVAVYGLHNFWLGFVVHVSGLLDPPFVAPSSCCVTIRNINHHHAYHMVTTVSFDTLGTATGTAETSTAS